LCVLSPRLAWSVESLDEVSAVADWIDSCGHGSRPLSALSALLQSASITATLPYMYLRTMTRPISPGLRSWCSESLHRSMNSRSVSHSFKSCRRLLSSGMVIYQGSPARCTDRQTAARLDLARITHSKESGTTQKTGGAKGGAAHAAAFSRQCATLIPMAVLLRKCGLLQPSRLACQLVLMHSCLHSKAYLTQCASHT